MVNLLIVAHSAKVAAGAREFVAQVAGTEVQIEDAGGTPDGLIGTSVDRVLAGLTNVASADGVIVLVDLGSAVINVELAIELHGGSFPTHISDAPLVEGAYLAAIEAAAGGSLDDVVAAALQARELVKVQR